MFKLRKLVPASIWKTFLIGPLPFFLFIYAAPASRNVRIGIYENSPKVDISEAGEPEGIFVDIIEEIAEKEGWSLKYVPGTWAQGLTRLQAGEIDIMPDVAYSVQRDEIFSFHGEPVLSDWFQVYARRGSGIISLLDLSGKRVGVLENSVQQDVFKQIYGEFDLDITLLPFSDYSDMFDLLMQNRIDAVISNRFYGVYHAKQYNMEDTAVIFNPTRLFFAAPKSGDTDILTTIDKYLVQFKKDSGSIYYKSLRRWTSEEVVPVVPAWIKKIAIVAGSMLLLSFLWTTSLKRQVNTRTRQLDISNEEITRLYKELQEYAETLEKRVAERTEELSQMNRELLKAKHSAEAADRTKSAFLASMSHELRTPLNSIIGFTGILLQGLAGPLNEEQTKQLRMVKNSGQHLLSLINDVLDISKIEAGQIDVASESFDIAESVQKMIQSLTPLADQKHLLLTAHIEPKLIQINSDKRRVEQILMNLLGNAIKFTEQGAVHIKVCIENEEVVIRISDTGIGIKPDDLKLLFQPFRQIDSGLARQHEGTGLGLVICKRLVEKLGGNITVKSEWEKGSSFQFTLPLFPKRDI